MLIMLQITHFNPVTAHDIIVSKRKQGQGMDEVLRYRKLDLPSFP